MKNIADRLQAVEKTLNLSPDQMAAAGGIGPSTYSNYRLGQSSPRFSPLERWARELGINGNWLLLGEGPMFREEAIHTADRPDKLVISSPTDPVVARAERIATLMASHGAEPEEIREAIMASMRAMAPHTGESKHLYAVQEIETPYTEK